MLSSYHTIKKNKSEDYHMKKQILLTLLLVVFEGIIVIVVG
ncbi:hypothetical protein STND_1323 [Streptococcus thermophilus ND03]|nr:hypothetical protein STND_1323 [Streptococcus thermophilus ND03]